MIRGPSRGRRDLAFEPSDLAAHPRRVTGPAAAKKVRRGIENATATIPLFDTPMPITKAVPWLHVAAIARATAWYRGT